MFSYLLGIMAITIYNQSYGSTGVLNIMNRYDKIMGDAMKNTAFSSMIATIKGLAVGFTIILYLIDLSGKVTEKNFSIEQFFKSTLRCVVTYMFIMNSSTIVGYLLDLGGAAAKEVSDQAGLDFFGGNEKSMLINGMLLIFPTIGILSLITQSTFLKHALQYVKLFSILNAS